MIEITILNYLKNKLDVSVFTEHQKEEPYSFVIFEKISSSLTNGINHATFAFQSYGASLLEACKLNERVKEAMLDMIELDEIGRVKLNSDYNFTDTTEKRYRYQAVFDITY